MRLFIVPRSDSSGTGLFFFIRPDKEAVTELDSFALSTSVRVTRPYRPAFALDQLRYSHPVGRRTGSEPVSLPSGGDGRFGASWAVQTFMQCTRH